MRLTTRHGWHFVGPTLRDGRPVPADGVTLRHDGPLVMCQSGLHFSRTPWDALRSAPSGTLCMVEIAGAIEEADKGVCRERTILARMDATELVRYFARMQSLAVVHLWDAPDVVLDYLMTGEETIRAESRDASWAYWELARSAVMTAQENTSFDSVRSAVDARNAAWNAWASSAAVTQAAWVTGSAVTTRDEFNALIYECFGVEVEA